MEVKKVRKNYNAYFIPSIVIFAVGIYLIFSDQKLNPKAEEVISYFDQSHTQVNNGTIYQMGFWTPLGEDPYQTGLEYASASREEVETLKERLFENLFDETMAPNWMCEMHETKGCLATMYEHSDEARPLLTKYQELIARYDTLIQFDTFSAHSRPSLESNLMHFGPGIQLTQLQITQLMALQKSEQVPSVVNRLEQMFSYHLRVLEQTPYAIPKVISMVEMGLLLDATAFLIARTESDQQHLWAPLLASLAPLEGAQLNIKNWRSLDFAAAANASQESIRLGFESVPWLPDYLIEIPLRVLYKPNKTLNLIYKYTNVDGARFELVDGMIVENLPLDPDDIEIDYLNYLGSMLVKLSIPRFLGLEKELLGLEVKRQMLQHLMALRFAQKQGTKGDIKSPHTGRPAFVDGDLYCIEPSPGLDKDQAHSYCIHDF